MDLGADRVYAAGNPRCDGCVPSMSGLVGHSPMAHETERYPGKKAAQGSKPHAKQPRSFIARKIKRRSKFLLSSGDRRKGHAGADMLGASPNSARMSNSNSGVARTGLQAMRGEPV